MICFPYWNSISTSVRTVGLHSIFQKSVLGHTRYIYACENLTFKEECEQSEKLLSHKA